MALVVVGFVENGVRRHEEASQDFDVLGESRFTIPVSVIVAAYNEETAIVSTVESLLDLDYPEFEVIAVNDGSSDGTLARLVDAFELEPYEVFVRHVFPTEDVRAIYRGRSHPNLVVVDKENGGKSDALNAGLNVAKLPLRMRRRRRHRVRPRGAAQGDAPRRRGSGADRRRHEPSHHRGEPRERHERPRRPATDRPAGRSWRTSISTTSAPSSTTGSRGRGSGFMLCAVGAFQIWRRDVLEEVGGYSRTFTCEDIELTFRVHEKFRREGRDYEIHCLPDNVGTTEGPGHRAQARLATRAVAARHQRDRVALPAHVVPASATGAWD